MNSLRERCNWGEENGRGERIVDGRALSSGGGLDSQDLR